MTTYNFYNQHLEERTLAELLEQDRSLIYVEFNGHTYQGVSGDDAIYFKKNGTGVKIMPIDHKTYRNNLDNLQKFKELNIPCFPTIFDIEVCDDVVILYMEDVPRRRSTYDDIKKCIVCMKEYELLPDNSWMKEFNLFGDKIVDFHRFRIMKERYVFSTHGKSLEEIQKIHQDALDRYRIAKKWKGKIYEGMYFDNGYVMPGYSSDNKIFDSFVKLPFCHLSGHDRILDIGCNEGFFSIQAALLGTREVIGIDKCEEDLAFAEDLRNYLELPNINYVLTDAQKYMNEHQNEKFPLILALSVIHQVYPNLVNADLFLRQINKMGRRVIVETPVNHPKMMMPVELVQQKLSMFCKNIRLLYLYNAYSSGERAIFVLYN
jgi:2-polyprenyl-3-methyl-5-hydroxy-6-metoxy-1,4-benzoquinol methylase